MNNPAFHYTFTSLDVDSFELEDFSYNRVNMTSFRLVDTTSERVRELLREMEEISPIRRAILNQSQVRQYTTDRLSSIGLFQMIHTL